MYIYIHGTRIFSILIHTELNYELNYDIIKYELVFRNQIFLKSRG